MEFQRSSFLAVNYPVYMIQGDSDQGQPNYLFGGTVKMDFIKLENQNLWDQFFSWKNQTHKLVLNYS